MGTKVGWGGFFLLAALVLGVASAGGRTLATTTVTVEVIGKGTATSNSPNSGIKCGNGKNNCYITFTTSTTITLSTGAAGGWTFASWGGAADTDACGTPTASQCEILPGGDHRVTANFSGPATTTSTLSVTSDHTNGDGNVSGPEHAPPGSNIDCGSMPAGTTCTWSVLTGSTLTVFQTPHAGDVFTGWGGACGGTGASCTVQMNGDQSVSAAWSHASATKLLTVSASGNGNVQGGGINCPSNCSATEPLNSSVTLTATPDDGYVFSTWGGACSGTSPTCTFTMTADTNVTATFVAATTLTVAVTGNGNVSGGTGAINCGSGATVCSANFAVNATVTLIATPALGATFAGWTGACGGTAITCTVSMSASKSVNANFLGGTAGTLLTVSVSGLGTVTGGGINCGNGVFTCSANETANSTVTLTETPASGATFAGWGGACSGTIPTCTVSMTSAMTVTATFTGGTALVSLSVSVSGKGTVTGGGINCGNGATTCSVSGGAGSSITLTATPASGASFTRWSGACSGSASTCKVILSVSTSVSATFSGGAAGVTLTLDISGRGTVSSSAGVCGSTGPKRTCAQHFAAGASVVLTQAPLAGAKFLGWGGACTGAKKICVLRLTGAKLVTATFSGATGRAVLTALASPLVRHTARGFFVTLRFGTTEAGMARIRAVRAGRVVTALSLRVGKGAATIGPFPVPTPGSYTFEIVLASHALHWRTCLGRCGAAAPGVFALTREPPDVARSGDVWSVTLRFRESLISDAHVRVYRGASLLTDHHFLGRVGEIAVGPFLLAPGNYTLRLTAVDPYGRVRTLTWLVALAR
jgi:uncharacterized repeat protein (TIGR02543 family)